MGSSSTVALGHIRGAADTLASPQHAHLVSQTELERPLDHVRDLLVGVTVLRDNAPRLKVEERDHRVFEVHRPTGDARQHFGVR